MVTTKLLELPNSALRLFGAAAGTLAGTLNAPSGVRAPLSAKTRNAGLALVAEEQIAWEGERDVLDRYVVGNARVTVDWDAMVAEC
jgi:hypothetical protein